MRTLSCTRGPALLLLAALSLAALAPLAAGHIPEGATFSRTYILTAYDRETPNGTVAWFMADNGTQANPTLEARPGEGVLLILVNAGDRNHTVVIQGAESHAEGAVAPGQEAYLWFRVPETATGPLTYHDPDWAQAGMHGTIHVQGFETPDESPLGPVAGLAGLLLGTLLLARSPGRKP